MSKRPVVPESKSNLDKFKTEVANDLGVEMNDDSNHPYMGSVSSKVAGKVAGKMGSGGNVGGEMVKRMIAEQERKMANKK